MINVKLNFNIEELRRALTGVLASESMKRVVSHGLMELAEHQILHKLEHYREEEEERRHRFGHPNAVFKPENEDLMP